MTPLIAGIALQGKAPMYENLYKEGEQKRQARKAAKAKADADLKKKAMEGFEFDAEGIHQHYIDASTNTFLDGFNKALELDPSTPNYENQVMYIITETEKKLNAFRDASKAAYTYESEDWQDGHLHSKQVVDFLSNNKFGDDVPTELQDEFGSYGIIYGAKDDGRPVLNVLSGQFAIEDYVEPYQKNVEKKKAVWEAMPEREKSTYVASKKYLDEGYTIPFELAREDIISYARDPRFYNNVRLTDGFDLNTEEGVVAFYEKYTPKEVWTKSGTPQSGGGGSGFPYGDFSGRGENRITLNHDGFVTNIKTEMTPLEQGPVVLNLNGAIKTGEAGQKVQMVRQGRLDKVVPVDIGRVNIWIGKDATIEPFQYTKEDGEKEMFNKNEPLVLKAGLPVPDELVEYLNRTPEEEVRAAMPGLDLNGVSNEWRIIGKAPLFSGSKTDEQMLIPATKDNILRYLKNIPVGSRRKEYEKLKKLGVYDGAYPTGGTPQGGGQQGRGQQGGGQPSGAGPDDVGDGIF